MTGLQHLPLVTIAFVWLGLAVILIGGIWLVWYAGNRRRRIRKRLGMFSKGKG